MSRVEMSTQGWGLLVRLTGETLAVVANRSVTMKLAGTATPATHYSAITGGTSSTAAFVSSSGGVLGRFIDEGSYDLTVGADTFRVEATAGDTLVSVESRVNGLDLSIREYTGLDLAGGSDMSTLLNTISAAANAVAVAGGYPYATLGGFGKGVYRIDSNLELRDKVRFRLDEARIVAGATLPASGMFRAVPTLTGAVAQGSGTTVSGEYVLTGVSAPLLWRQEDRITKADLPADTKVVAVDVLNSRLVVDKAATGSSTSTITKGATYYGSLRNAGLIGGEFDPNGFDVGAIVRALWTENFLVDNTSLLQNRGATTANWAWQLGGRNMLLNVPKVVGGSRVTEDALHVEHGQHIRIVAPDVESGDDGIVLGGEPAEVSLAASPDPIRHVTIEGGSVRALRGFGLSIYVQSGATGRDWEISDIEARGIVGEAGVLRNGGIRVVDLNAGAAGTTQIRRVNIDGLKLAVGSKGHDDVQAHAIWVTSASDVTISNVRMTVTEGAAAATGFDFAKIDKSEDVTLDNIGCPSLPRRFACDVSASPRVTLKNSKLTQNPASPFSNVPIRLVSSPDFKALDNEFTGLRTGQPMVSCTTGTGTTATFRGNTPKVTAATTGYGFDLVAAAIDRLVVIDNDLSDLDGDFTDLSILRTVPFFEVRDNIGYPDRNMTDEPFELVFTGRNRLDALTAASTPAVLHEAGSGVAGASNGGLALFRWDPTDVAKTGQSAKMRLRFNVTTNATAPVANFTAALYPVSASLGGAAVVAVNVGAQAVTAVAATDLFTRASHGYSAGDEVLFYTLTGGAGITPGRRYYVIASGLTANDFKVSATSGGATIDVTSDLSAGTVIRSVKGSAVEISTPAALVPATAETADFDAPAAGHYVVMVTLSADMAASSSAVTRITVKARAL